MTMKTTRGKRLTEGVVDAHSPGHTLFTLNGGKHLCRVLESNWAFAKGVANCEKVDKSFLS